MRGGGLRLIPSLQKELLVVDFDNVFNGSAAKIIVCRVICTARLRMVCHPSHLKTWLAAAKEAIEGKLSVCCIESLNYLSLL
jgi:hypothetical protein